MARKQTRRTVSLNRRVFEAATEYAIDVGIPLSRIVEDLLLSAIADEHLNSDIAAHRDAVVLATTPKPPRPPGKRGRPLGNSGSCSACGEAGHFASRDGLCSPIHLAAVDVLEHDFSTASAAKAHSVSRDAIYKRVHTLRKRSA